MAEEGNRYGPPTHTCKHCSVCFPATWEHISDDHRQFHSSDVHERLLNVDLLLNGPAAVAAALDGCRFYLSVLYPFCPGSETTSVGLLIERRTSFAPWGEVEPYLRGRPCHKPAGLYGHPPTMPNTGYWESAAVAINHEAYHDKFDGFRVDGQPQGDSWFDDLSLPPRLKPVSTVTIASMRNWLGQCNAQTRSSTGIHIVSGSVMPKRLLRIDPTSNIVYVTATTQTQEYALLSYCWGGNQDIKTTSSTLEAQEHGIQVGTLPCTIRDAIKITRELNLDYLWVDALCIVQDDPVELASEIANQAKLYQNGIVTILAGGAASVADGFLQRRSREQTRFDLRIRLQDGGENRLSFHLRPEYPLELIPNDLMPRDPVDKRGWIFQEVLLSPNLVYFDDTQLFCFSGCSVYTDGGLPGQAFTYRSSAYGINTYPSTGGYSNDFYTVWQDLILNYSRLQLSHSADKLLAVCAVAEAFGVTFLGHDLAPKSYEAGLWKQHMPLNLLWSTFGDEETIYRPVYRAPSWSPMSIDRGVYIYNYELGEMFNPDWYTAKVVSVQTQLASQIAPYGQVLGGELQIDGLLKQIPTYSAGPKWITLSDEDYNLEHDCFLDATEPDMIMKPGFEPDLLVFVLSIVRLPYGEEEFRPSGTDGVDDADHFRGLVLCRRPDADTYTRIALFTCHRLSPVKNTGLKRWQQSFERKVITIV